MADLNASQKAPADWIRDDWAPDPHPTLAPEPRQTTEPTIRATPYTWRDPETIPLRPWVYGRWLLRNTITAVIAPGGVGKSSLMASTILALAAGRSLLGKSVWDGPKRTWYWNLEDDTEELSRQIQAAAKHHRVSAADCGGRLFVDSGLDGAGLCTAIEGRDGFRVLQPVIEALVDELISRQIDVLIIDPFVSSHAISENDNGAVDAVAKEWARVAKRASCSIVLVHHTRKLGGMKVTSEMARGAVALIAAARSTLVLNRMDTDEAERFGIDGDDERRRYFSIQDDKANRAPAEKAEWYRMASVNLGNGDAADGDNIGVVTCWSPPDPFDGVAHDLLYRAQMAIAEGQWRESQQSPHWAGVAVATVMGIDLDGRSSKKRVAQMLKQWIENGALKVVDGKDERRKLVKFIEVGRWQNDTSAPPLQVERSKVEQSRTKICSTTTPLGVGGWSGAEQQRGSQVEQNAPVSDRTAKGFEDGERGSDAE
jgi:hypothetical protein